MDKPAQQTEPPLRISPYERFQRARKWIWSNWTDEAPIVYRRTAHGKDRARVLWVEFLLFVREVVRGFYLVQGSARAASLAYTTLLSLIPLLIAFSIVLRGYFAKLFPDFKTQTDSLINLIVPYQSSQIAYHINRFVESAEAASTFGAIVFLLVSFRLFSAVEATINQIWHVPSARSYRQKLRAFTMLFFWGPMLMGISFTTSASLQSNEYLNVIAAVTPIVSRIVLFGFLFVAFTMLFWLVPSSKVHIRSAAVGAIVTAVLFELVRFGFGLYAKSLFSGQLNVIYGAVGLLIIFLLALELMWVVILIGVQISYVHQNLEGVLRASEQKLEEKASYNLYFAMRALVEIARRFEAREDAPSSYRLAESYGATDPQMLAVLRKLEDARLVKEIGGDWTGFVPGGDPDKITVVEVVQVMEGSYREIPPSELGDPERRLVSELFETLHECTSQSLQQVTIGQLVRRLYGQPQPSRQNDSPAVS